MKVDAILFRHWAWIVVLPCVVALSGCGTREMFHVRGKVMYKDGSVPKGTLAVVYFTPAEVSSATIRKGASGAITPDGSFEMVTRMTGDGVHRGEYGVTFRVLQQLAGGSTVPLVAQKYSLPAPPQFTVKVDRDISDLSYEIERAEGPTAAAAAAAAATSTTPTGPGSGPGT
jgi:hypothetical protein